MINTETRSALSKQTQVAELFIMINTAEKSEVTDKSHFFLLHLQSK